MERKKTLHEKIVILIIGLTLMGFFIKILFF